MFKQLISVALVSFFSLSVSAQGITIKDYPADKISTNVYVIHGPTAVPNASNQGFMNNPGIIMTSKGVVLIDPGSTIESGEMTLRAVKKLTNKPVVAVFNTHIHADHWFGNAAIMQAYPNIPIYAHQFTFDNAQETGKDWIGTLKNLTHSDQLKKDIVTANKVVNHGTVINIGDTSFTVYNYGVSHSLSDIMISVNDGEAVFMGDNLFNGRLNSHTAGHIKKTWLAVEAAVKDSNAQMIVPGHGQSGGRDMLNNSLDLHKILYQSVKKQYEDDMSDFEMRDNVEKLLTHYKGWVSFDSELGKVINKAFLEIEEADF